MFASRLFVSLALLILTVSSSAPALEITLQNDGFFPGANAGFQGGFAAGEVGASRFALPNANTHQLKKIQLLFGGAGGQQAVTLNIYDDSAGTDAPGSILYTGDYVLTGDDTVLQEINISAFNVMVSDDFRVGIQFQHSGAPSIARDDDGNIDATKNFIFANGFGWVKSNLLGLTGDWIIRAVVEEPAASTYTVGGSVTGLNGTLILQNNGGDDLVITADGSFTFATPLSNGASYSVTVLSEPATQDCVIFNGSGTISSANVNDVSIVCNDSAGAPIVLQNDGFTTGANAAFQSGFDIGEIAAARFVPAGPTNVRAVRFLYGGSTATRTIRLQIWDDTLLADAPGTLLYAADFQLTGSDSGLQEIDLSSSPVAVSGAFRAGIQFYDAGLPSVARDDDGNITPNRNFILAGGVGWVESSTLGLTGDWILRAVVDSPAAGNQEPLILGISDVGNDQGRQVRIEFAASAEDDPGSLEPVVAYEAYRRIEEGLMTLPVSDKRLAGWEFVGSVPSHGEATYNMIAPTLADSTVAEGMQWSVFFIRAATASPFSFYDSPPDSGFSLDNLAPGIPQNLAVGGGQLDWDDAPESDFAYFRIYGAPAPELDGNETLLGASPSSSFDASTTPHDWYLVTAVDFAGNESMPAAASAATATAALPRRGLRLGISPNPFNPATEIRFELSTETRVTLQLFDSRGRLVDTLLAGALRAPGEHRIPYRSELASGVYLVRVVAGDQVEQRKMTLLR